MGGMRSDQDRRHELNPDCWKLVLKTLSTQDLAMFSMVCKSWKEIGDDATAHVLNFASEAQLAREPMREHMEEQLDEYDFLTVKNRNRIANGLKFYIKKRAHTLHTIIIDIQADGFIAQQVLEAASHCTALRILHLRDLGDRDNPIQSVTLKNLPSSLRILRLSHHVAGFEEETEPKQLKVFHCFLCPMKALENPGTFNLFQGVKSLRLREDWSHKGLMWAMRRFVLPLEGLEYLSILGVSRITTQFWQDLMFLPKLKHLILEDARTINSSEVPEFPQLVSLDIYADSCNLDIIEGLLRFPQLRILSIGSLVRRPRANLQVFPAQPIQAAKLEVLKTAFQHSAITLDVAHLLSPPELQLLDIRKVQAVEIRNTSIAELEAVKLLCNLKANLEILRGLTPELMEVLKLQGFNSDGTRLQRGLEIGTAEEFYPQYQREISQIIQEKKSCSTLIDAVKDSCMHFAEQEVYLGYLDYLKSQGHLLDDYEH